VATTAAAAATPIIAVMSAGFLKVPPWRTKVNVRLKELAPVNILAI